MKQGLTDISLVLDSSGSMSAVRDETISSFNEFIKQQKKLPGDCLFSLYQFNTSYDVIHRGLAIKEVPVLDQTTFVPSGYTALLDAIGKTILETGERLKNMPEHERPAKMCLVILTDGQENSSKEFSQQRVKSMIQHQTDVYQWDFVFLGANIDAIATAAGVGIVAGKAMNFAATGQGVKNVTQDLMGYYGTVRSAPDAASVKACGFTDEERERAMADK